jgi:hypothetical protein
MIIFSIIYLKNYYFYIFIYLKITINILINFLRIMGIGDWGLGIGDWGLGPIPNPH